MMRHRAGYVCLLAGLFLAAPAGAQTPDELVDRGVRAGADAELLAQLRARALEAGLDEAATAALLTPAVTAAADGLPSRVLAQKGLEGLAKRVPTERIVELLERLRTHVERGGELLDPWLAGAGGSVVAEVSEGGLGDGVRATLVESTALGLLQGAPETVIRELLDRVPGALAGRGVTAVELGVGIEVIPQIPLMERDAALTAELVVGALASGFDAGQLRELPAALRAAERRGEHPAEAVARGAMAQFRELPAATVLENLFQGEFPGGIPFDLPPGLENAGGRGRPPPPPPPPGA